MENSKKTIKRQRRKLIENTIDGIACGNIVYVLAFVIPLVMFVILYFLNRIYPFGNNCYLRSDMYHQYAPFFSELWNKIRNGESLTYSWNIGMGTNFTSLMAYYLASPINWIIALFPQKYMIEIMNVIIILKLTFSSLTMCYYITHHFNTKKAYIAAFGIFYAFSGYVAAYSWNIMWLDCILLLPLIMLGLERLVNENKCFLYCITLGLCIFTNYYISIMVCLSVILYFLVLIIAYNGPRKPVIYIKKILNWCIYSLLAGGLAACLLLPELYTFSLSASSTISFPKKVSAYFSILEMLVRQLMNVPVHMGLEHYPNIYCGVAIFILIPLYIMNKKINIREKIGKCLLLLAFLLAYNINILNFIWHGLHFPNSLPCRQAFIYIFFVIIMSYEALQNIREYTNSQFTGSVWFGIIFLVLSEQIFNSKDDYGLNVFYISGAFILLYALVFYLARSKKFHPRTILFAGMCLAVIEAIVNMNETGLGTTSRSAYLLDYNAVKTVTETVEENDGTFYRMDKITGARSKNDGAWHNYHTISTFSSTSNEGMSKLYKNIGMIGTTNAYGYDGSTLLTNSLFSVKYLISNQILAEDKFMTYYTGSDGEFIYQNNYTLPIGFMVDKDFDNNWTPTSLLNGIENQNSMIKYMTGVSDVFELLIEYGTGNTFTFMPEKSGHLYLVYENTDNKSITVYAGNKFFDFSNLKSNPHTLDIGYVSDTDEVTIIADEPMSLSVYLLNSEKFIEAYNILNESSLNVTKWSDTRIDGTINVKEDGTFFLSIPYDAGWSLYVDGKKTDTYAIEDALLGAYLTTGEHTVVLKYTPVNLILGCIITLICIIILVAIYQCKKMIAKGTINITKLPPSIQNLINEKDEIIAAKKSVFDDNFNDDDTVVTGEDSGGIDLNIDSSAILKNNVEKIMSDMDDFDNI